MTNQSSKIFSERFKHFSRAFEYRNYRLYFGGQAVSLVGTWMQRTAMPWLVYTLTGSTVLLGVIGFISNVPTLFVSPFVGVMADIYDRRRIIIITQFLAAVQAFILAYLVLTGQIKVWHIIVLSGLAGTIFAFDMPSRHAFLSDMIEKKEDLGNAVAMNSLLFNFARLIGPSFAGYIIEIFKEGICFLLNGISYLPIVATLFMMRIKPREVEIKKHDFMADFKEGAVYSFNYPPIKTILILMSVVGFAAVPYLTFMPVFAKDIFHGNSQTLGFLMGSVGVGAIFGGVAFASRPSLKGLGTNIAVAAMIFSVGIILFALSKNQYYAMLFLALTGYGQISMFSSANTALQTISDEDKRGRVMAFYSTAIMGVTPFGSLLAGVVADKIGAPMTMAIGGAISLLAAFNFLAQIPMLRKIVRPIFIAQGVKYDE